MKRKAHIPAKEKLAAALLMCVQPDESGKLVRVISHDEARLMTADQIISLFHFDHDPIREIDGGPAAAWNLTPRLIADHRRKTAKVDLPQIAKGKRIRRAEARHAEAMAMRGGQAAAVEFPTPVRARRKSVIPGSKASPYRKKFSGRVEMR